MGIKKIINKDVTKDLDFLCFYLRLHCLRGSNRDTWRPRALVLFSSLASFPRHLICKSIKRRSVGKCSVPAQCYGSGSSSRKVSHEWLDTLWVDSNTNNRNNGPSHKRIRAAYKQRKYKLAYCLSNLKIVILLVNTLKFTCNMIILRLDKQYAFQALWRLLVQGSLHIVYKENLTRLFFSNLQARKA